MFNKRLSKNKVNRTVNALIPVSAYDSILDAYKMKDGSFMDLTRINCSDLRNMSDNELEQLTYEWTNFYQTFGYDLKLIAINVPENSQEQISFINKKLDREKHPERTRQLKQEKNILEQLEKVHERKEYFLMTFADSADEMNDQKGKIAALLLRRKRASVITSAEKDIIITKLYNQTASSFKRFDHSSDEVIEKHGFDPELIYNIQPAGGVKPDNYDHVRTGREYIRCIHVYDYPAETSAHWMRSMISLQNTIVTIDMHTENPDDVQRNINMSFREQELRITTDRKTTEIMDASDRHRELTYLRDAVNRQGEIIKMIAPRIFVSAGTMEELDKRSENIINILTNANGYKAAAFLNEQKEEWLSLFMPYKEQQLRFNHIQGQPMTSTQIAEGNPFHFSYLSDPTGVFMGKTSSNGCFKWNLFTSKPPYRTSYNMFICGVSGSGKSTTLKRIAKVNNMFSNYTRVFDPSGEWMTIARKQGALYLDLADTGSRLNFFQIQKTGENEQKSYSQHVTNLTTIYTILAGTDEYADDFRKMLSRFYIRKELLNAHGIVETGTFVTGLPADCYPTISDFIEFGRYEIENYESYEDPAHQKLDEMRLVALQKIVDLWESIKLTYGHLLDGYSTIRNITDYPFVIFGLKEVFKLPPRIQAAVIFNALQLCWDNAVRNGIPQKDLYDRRMLKEEDIRYFLIELDEFHHFINEQTKEAIDVLQVMMREMRKYFGGIVLSTQNASDLTSSGKGTDSLTSLVTKLMELSACKFIGQQSSQTMPEVRKLFESILTEAELERIPHLGQGEFLVTLSSEQNMEVKIMITKEEVMEFSGGR